MLLPLLDVPEQAMTVWTFANACEQGALGYGGKQLSRQAALTRVSDFDRTSAHNGDSARVTREERVRESADSLSPPTPICRAAPPRTLTDVRIPLPL
jgi:hypothetical protein